MYLTLHRLTKAHPSFKPVNWIFHYWIISTLQLVKWPQYSYLKWINLQGSPIRTAYSPASFSLSFPSQSKVLLVFRSCFCTSVVYFLISLDAPLTNLRLAKHIFLWTDRREHFFQLLPFPAGCKPLHRSFFPATARRNGQQVPRYSWGDQTSFNSNIPFKGK